MDRIEALESILSRQLGWIAASDAKGKFLFPVAAAMLGLLAALAPEKGCWTTATVIFTSAAGLLLASSIVFCAFAAFPRTDGPHRSNIYCGGIASRSADAYTAEMKNLSEDAYITDLASQCHVNAEIASAKFGWIQWALGAVFLAVSPWVLSVYFLYNLK